MLAVERRTPFDRAGRPGELHRQSGRLERADLGVRQLDAHAPRQRPAGRRRPGRGRGRDRRAHRQRSAARPRGARRLSRSAPRSRASARCDCLSRRDGRREAAIGDPCRAARARRPALPHRLVAGREVQEAVARAEAPIGGGQRVVLAGRARGPRRSRRTCPRPTRGRRPSPRGARCPRSGRGPLRSRASSASWTPWAAKMPASRSPIAMPARVGPLSGVPVRLMKPLMPWAIWSNPGRSR